MTNFETILEHLGPSAKPLMAFLDLADAKNMLFISRYTSSLISAYSKRWGFKLPPYMEYSDGSFAITIRGETTKFKPLKPHHTLMFDRIVSRTILDNRTHSLVIHGCRSTRIIYGTRSEIKEILACAKPYKLKRELRLKQQAIEAGERKEIADAVAAKAAYLAKYTIKAPGPPTYPWGKKPSA